MAIPERVGRVLKQHGLKPVEFAAGSTHTAQAAARQLGVQTAQIAKSILFSGTDGRFLLALCRGNCRVSTSRIEAVTGARMRMASAAEVRAATGLPPGSVCPFGLDGEIAIIIDRGLAEYRTIYPAAGSDSSSVALDFEGLVAITGGQVADITRPDCD